MSLEIDGNKVVCEILETASKDRAEGKAGDLYEATGWLDRVTDRQVNLAADCKCPFCEKGLESDTTEFSDGITNGSQGDYECKKCGFKIGWISVDGYGHYTVSPGESGPLSGIDMGELAERISKEIDSGGESKKEGENKEAEMIRYHFIKEREGKVARESIAHYLAKRFLWHEHERTNVKRMPGPGSENAGPARQTNKA